MQIKNIDEVPTILENFKIKIDDKPLIAIDKSRFMVDELNIFSFSNKIYRA